jgi:hypothetical protein
MTVGIPSGNKVLKVIRDIKDIKALKVIRVMKASLVFKVSRGLTVLKAKWVRKEKGDFKDTKV